ncbi:MAG TPA: hypothetical protein VF370_06005 [Candidatus Cryosericum sp.]
MMVSTPLWNDLRHRIGEARKALVGVSPNDVLSSLTEAALSAPVWHLAEFVYNNRLRQLDLPATMHLEKRLANAGVADSAIENYCQRLPSANGWMYKDWVLEALVLIFDVEVGITSGPEIVQGSCSSLAFDKDRLAIIAPGKTIQSQKEGLLVDGHYIKYAPELRRYNVALSGGFLEHLTNLAHLTDGALHVSIALNEDLLMDSEYYARYETRAYMYGPKGFSQEHLQDAAFPENPSGTVTVHRRVSDDPLLRLMMPLESTEILWSARDGAKTVQIEELCPFDQDLGYVMNRYVHARWDVTKRCFSHLDGAVRMYNQRQYEHRCSNDIRHCNQRTGFYKKLFRVDGTVDVTTWNDLVSSFYYGNELVLEYLNSV